MLIFSSGVVIMSKTAFLFPGQGSQFVGMGKDFYEAFSWARDLFAQADEITQKPITRLCFEGPLEELTLTVNLQPAITAVNLVCYLALSEKGIKPDCTAGHSLGEYAALAAAGVITPADALKLVNLRGELMQRDADRNPGAMQAVIGLSIEVVEAITELARDRGVVAVANHNSPQQVVITGQSEAVATAIKFVETKGGKHLPLPVSGAWHSPLMEKAAADFALELNKIEFKSPECPIYLNVTGLAAKDPVEIKKVMAGQITSPVRWCDIITNMVAEGVDVLVETGPKKVLAGLARKTAPRDARVGIVNVQDLADLEAAAGKIGR